MSDYMKIDTNLPPYFPYPQFLMDMALSHTAARKRASNGPGGLTAPHQGGQHHD